MSAGQGNRIRSFTLVDPVSSTGCASRFAARLTGSTRVKAAFTLVELLIVIAILAVLAAAVVIVLNPAELLAQARDSQRITDLKTTKDAIDLFILDNPSASLGTAQKVYVSLPDAAAPLCTNNLVNLPTLPVGWSYQCAAEANIRNTDGTGWIPLNLGNINGGSPIPYLPIDPQNDAVTGRYYTYTMGGSYQLSALMEAQKSFAIKDGGFFPEMFETGSDLSLLPVSRDPSLVGHWRFDGTGSISNGQTAGFSDYSGNGNNGTATNTNGTGMGFTDGKVGSGVQMDGVDDLMITPSLSGISDTTWAVWIKPSLTSAMHVIKCNGNADYMITNTAVKAYRVRTFSGSGDIHTVSGPLPADQWSFLTIAFTNPGISVYLNGQLENQNSSYTFGNLNSSYRFGGYGAPEPSFNGVMDEVRIYDRALSGTEIKALYDATK